ncbi:MAG: DNA methyltransferase [Pseudomonadota bacterium]|nr:DNA methyltransferase [Pseudomonadota bacterium]
MFNASTALGSSPFSKKIVRSNDQDLLDIKDRDRTSVLPWRGQFSPQLVDYLLDIYAPKEGVVVDPFCGSGTVLYESAQRGLSSYGCDINPAAICLAQFSSVSAMPYEERCQLIITLDSLFNHILSLFNKEERIDLYSVAEVFFQQKFDTNVENVLKPFLLLSAGSNNYINEKKMHSSVKYIKKYLLNLPYTKEKPVAEVSDARQLRLESNSVDYIVTSPPYINVFNYHQNYRPILEALGYTPLKVATAEVGANRKFRQNRYMTVVQYCMDMAQYMVEAARVLRNDNGCMTIVLGRESRVRGTAFKNGELIAAISSEGLGGKIIDWKERSFLNRFGERIYEDVITLKPNSFDIKKAKIIGKNIGIEALKSSLNYCDKDKSQEIEMAINRSGDINSSPILEKENCYG